MISNTKNTEKNTLCIFSYYLYTFRMLYPVFLQFYLFDLFVFNDPFGFIFSVDFQKFWCSVEKSILFYESDRCHEPSMKINVKDIICLGVNRPDSSNNSGFIDK